MFFDELGKFEQRFIAVESAINSIASTLSGVVEMVTQVHARTVVNDGAVSAPAPVAPAPMPTGIANIQRAAVSLNSFIGALAPTLAEVVQAFEQASQSHTQSVAQSAPADSQPVAQSTHTADVNGAV